MLWIAPADEAESNFLGGNLLIGLKFKQSDAELEELDPDEREAILLAECLRADFILLGGAS